MRVFNHQFSVRNVWKLRGVIFPLLRRPRRIKNLILLFYSLLFKRAKVKGDPVIIMVEPSSRCNLACPFCPRELNDQNRKEGELAIDQFKALMDELGETLMFLVLFNYGEPLLNDRLPEMITYAKEKGISVALSTNATLLTPKKSSELIKAGLDFMIIPFDGATKTTYEFYRKNAVFEKTLSNIRSFMDEKRKQKKKVPVVDLQLIIMKHNEQEIGLFKDLARDLVVDMVTLKKVVYVKGREDEFLPENDDMVCDYYRDGIHYNYCNRLTLSSVINANGDVVPCCSDINFKYVFGNAFSGNGFRGVWNNERYQEFRRNAYKDIKSVDICQNCAGANFNPNVYL